MVFYLEEVEMEFWRKDFLVIFYGLKIFNIVEYLGVKKCMIVVYFVYYF